MWHALLAGSLGLQSCAGWAQGRDRLGVPQTRQMQGLSASEATTLLATLADAQRGLRTGKFQSFELLTGSIASYPMTKVSARDAFLQVQFEEVWKIERGSRENPSWNPYRLSYAPDGLGRLYWDIEVVLGTAGNIERVLMTYKPPAPF